MMSSKAIGGLGFLPIIPILISTAIGTGASVAAGKLLAPKPKVPDPAETLAMQLAMEQQRKQTMILVAAAGVFVVFVIGALR